MHIGLSVAIGVQNTGNRKNMTRRLLYRGPMFIFGREWRIVGAKSGENEGLGLVQLNYRSGVSGQ